MKKIIALCLVVILAATAVIGGTLAYFTDGTEEVKNTFSVGNVTIDLDEADVDLYGDVELDEEEKPLARVTANEYKLIPGHKYTKDPVIHVAQSSEPCWLFVKVVNEITAIEADTTIAAQMATNGWTAVKGETGVYAYKETVDARTEKKDITVFENFTVKTDADVSDYNGKTITVMGYAVQADGFNSAAAAWAAAPSNWGVTTETPDAGEGEGA